MNKANISSSAHAKDKVKPQRKSFRWITHKGGTMKKGLLILSIALFILVGCVSSPSEYYYNIIDEKFYPLSDPKLQENLDYCKSLGSSRCEFIDFWCPRVETRKCMESLGYRESNKIPVKYDQEAIGWTEKSKKSALKENWIEAIRTASTAILIDPNFAAPYIIRCWAYSEKGFFDKAIQDCNKALEIDPNNAYAYNNRGLGYHRKGDKNRAKLDYEKACNHGLKVACKNYKEITGYLPSK